MLLRTVQTTSAIQLRRVATATPRAKGAVGPAFTYKSDPVAAKEYLDHEAASAKHGKDIGELWRKISLFVVAPIIALTSYSVYGVEKAHHAHLKAHPIPPDSELPKEYDYQNVRNSR